MKRGDRVTIADTSLNNLRGLPVGRECIVRDVIDRFGMYYMLSLYDPLSRAVYYVTQDRVDFGSGPEKASAA